MAWTFVRPVDPSVLAGRPLLDLGTGDGQTVLALTDGGLRVGIDRSADVLRAARRAGLTSVLAADADVLPFAHAVFETVVAGDLFHHTDDAAAHRLLTEIRRVIAREGNLVAWWYSAPGRGGAGDPPYPRAYEEMVALVRRAGFADAAPLDLEFALEPSPPTVGLRARV